MTIKIPNHLAILYYKEPMVVFLNQFRLVIQIVLKIFLQHKNRIYFRAANLVQKMIKNLHLTKKTSARQNLFRGVTKKVGTADCLLLTVFIPSLFELPERFPNLLFRLFFHIAKLLLQQIYKKAANLTAGCFGINQKAKV